MSNYVCYHLHTMDSLLDSCTRFEEYVDKAVELGQKAICFTEHGNIFNWGAKKLYCESKGIKYLHGIECYLTERFKNEDNEEDKNIRDNYHTILIAKNFAGWVELNNLFYNSSNKKHTYYKWRLSFDEFFGISDNIIKISACVQSPLNKYRLNAKERGLTENDKKVLAKLLKKYDYYEIQYHSFQEQIEYNQYLYKMSKRFNKPLIVGTDTHSINEYKAECRTVLQYGKTDGAWGDEENECDLTYKSYDELVAAFKKQNSLPMDVVLEAIENTNRMADSVEEIVIDRNNKYPLLYGEDDEKVLWKTIKSKLKYKVDNGIIPKDKRYADNIKEEMRVFKKIDMIGFMLFMSEIMTWAKEHGIATGFARGSVAGSTVAYITDITDVDPVKWNTVFSRFANEHRVEAGDIDTDWYEDDRQKIYDYIIDRFGKDKTAYIFATSTLADKAIIDVIGKAFRIKAEKNGEQSEYTLGKIKEIKEEYEKDAAATREKYKELFYYYDGLANCVVARGQHPAGIVVSPINLVDNFGGFYGDDGQTILPIDMEECHDFGLIKFDILGLKSVGVIDKTYKLLGKKFPRADQVDWEDQAVFEDISNDSTAIFQFESDFAKQSIKKMQPRSVDDICLCSACLRPSGETYRDRVYNREWNKNPSKIIDDILSNSYGFLVYQEQTIAFLQQVCGFSGSDADNIRRAIGKKDREKIEKALPIILDGYCNSSSKPRDVAEEEAKQFLEVIESSSGYSFGFNHAEAYAMLGYLMGWLRYYYPTEFCTSFLNCAKNDDDIVNGTILAKSRGCTIVEPKFRYSSKEYSCDANKKLIFKGMSSIKNISDSAADDLYALRDNIYDSFIELLVDIKDTKVNSRQLDILIKLDFFSEFGEINELLQQRDVFDEFYGKKQIKFEKWQYDPNILRECAGKCTEKMAKDLDSIILIRRVIDSLEPPKTTPFDKIKYEKEFLGYISTTIPGIVDDCYYVTGTTGYNNKTLVLYNLKTGESLTIKNRTKKQKAPKEDDIIRITEMENTKKYKPIGKDENGKMQFERIDEYETVLTGFSFVNVGGKNG